MQRRSTGEAARRASRVRLTVALLTLLVMSQAAGQSSYLIVPFVLVLLSFAGTLVFTRLLGPRSG